MERKTGLISQRRKSHNTSVNTTLIRMQVVSGK
jgi:hypothetical protein